MVETLEAVKEDYDAAMTAGKPVGIGCAMKNAGVGVGIPDTGRVKLIVEDDEKLHIYSGASCIGQAIAIKATTMITATASEAPTTVDTDLSLSPNQPPIGAPINRVPY